ncbi:MarR family winged helix-turn-helix transcriptional regulator [Alkalihalobacterium bogoriense]|uniref:MarR family winged helix-turn-helix transcriptional regulator n=1 Tax=Alkalihalobacterium bogoriense TaxID=246272 RepID=UPI0006863875|nr:MarR family transcriptional regulator [Alkalihalobacterium bogoriense]
MDKSYLHVLVNNIRGLTKILENDLEKAAENIGLTASEHHILCIVFVEKEITMSEIAEVGLLDISTVMQVIKRLIKKGFVQTAKKETDRRITYVTLTEKGKTLHRQSFSDTYLLFNYIEAKLEKSSERDHEQTTYFLEFLKEVNEDFHGSDYIHWIHRSQKIIDVE